MVSIRLSFDKVIPRPHAGSNRPSASRLRNIKYEFELLWTNRGALSLGVEFLLLAATVFLAVAARQMQHLANRKIQFVVAGVSHELRTPVSAIG